MQGAQRDLLRLTRAPDYLNWIATASAFGQKRAAGSMEPRRTALTPGKLRPPDGCQRYGEIAPRFHFPVCEIRCAARGGRAALRHSAERWQSQLGVNGGNVKTPRAFAGV